MASDDLPPMTWQDRARYRQELLAEYEEAIDNQLAKRRAEDTDSGDLFD